MKINLFFCIIFAVVLHVGVILFGGLVLVSHKKDYSTLQQVELLSESNTVAEKEKPKEKLKEQESATEEKNTMEMENKQAPDSAEIIRSLELSAAASAPTLEAASLGAIEAALSGQSLGEGDFSEAVTFSSGGRIGGMGKTAELSDNLEREFDLTEIDQKPRVIIQGAPVYPAAMRSTKAEGLVSVIFIVDPTGKVINPHVEKSTNPAFEKPVLDAVKQWKFEPAIKGGQRVSCKMCVPIRFQPR